MNTTNMNEVGSTGNNIGILAGKSGSFVSNVISKFSLYISNMSVIEWILLLIIVSGGFLVWYLKNRFNLKFTWGTKKRKNTFN